MAIQHTYVQEADGTQSIAVFHKGNLCVATSAHPSFEAILVGVRAGDESVVDLFEPAKTVAAKFERLTDRITVENGNILFDGTVVHNAITEQIVRFLDEGIEDWKPLAAFLDNVFQNPSPVSRDELCDWVGGNESLTITEDGYVVGYKKCYVNSEGVATSTVNAPASDEVRVDDVLVTGPVPNVPGTTVTMPRHIVDPDQNAHCSKGLHIGTYGFASGFAGDGGVVVEVHVNPRDFVSVTSDERRRKIRACRYEVVKVVTEKYEQAVIPASTYRSTNDNHKRQERYPAGTYIGGKPMGGRFIPVGV